MGRSKREMYFLSSGTVGSTYKAGVDGSEGLREASIKDSRCTAPLKQEMWFGCDDMPF